MGKEFDEFRRDICNRYVIDRREYPFKMVEISCQMQYYRLIIMKEKCQRRATRRTTRRANNSAVVYQEYKGIHPSKSIVLSDEGTTENSISTAESVRNFNLGSNIV